MAVSHETASRKLKWYRGKIRAQRRRQSIGTSPLCVAPLPASVTPPQPKRESLSPKLERALSMAPATHQQLPRNLQLHSHIGPKTLESFDHPPDWPNSVREKPPTASESTNTVSEAKNGSKDVAASQTKTVKEPPMSPRPTRRHSETSPWS